MSEEPVKDSGVLVSSEIPKRPLSLSEAGNVISTRLKKTDEQLQAEAEKKADEFASKHKSLTFKDFNDFLEYVLSLMDKFPEFKLEQTLLRLRLFHSKKGTPRAESYRIIARDLAQILKAEVRPDEVMLAEKRAISIAKNCIEQVREVSMPLVGGMGDYAGTRFNRPGKLKEEPGLIIRPS